jgi:DNA-binding CsgD family transcriptional regulator
LAASVTIEARVLSLVGDVLGLLDLGEFRAGLLDALPRAVPADWVSLNEVGPDPQTTLALVEPPAPRRLHDVFALHAHENPILRWYQETGDGRAIRFSDVIAQKDLHALDLYRKLYREMNVEYQIAFTLPSTAERLLAIALSRGQDDFTDQERDLLNLARPHLIQGYRNALLYSSQRDSGPRGTPTDQIQSLQALGLTTREAQVLRLASMGRSDRDIAPELQISYRTVQKHLQNCYRKLGVGDRSEAAGIAWLSMDPPA